MKSSSFPTKENDSGHAKSKSSMKRNSSFDALLGMVEEIAPQTVRDGLHAGNKVLSFWKEFLQFAFQGSMLDLAVGHIMGSTFGKLINSFVGDIAMPPIGYLLRGVDFRNMFIVLRRGKKHSITKETYKSLSQAVEDGAVIIKLGVFLNTLINFIVLSIIIFILVRGINRHKLKNESEKKIQECPHCFSSISIKAVKCPRCTSSISFPNSSTES